jgi:hypothetical protein
MNWGQLTYPQNLWDHNFGFFWYNDPEIFDWEKADYERKAKDFADTGINHVITFSVTHFRWSFHQHWDVINAALKKLVDACHKYNIYVTEHHSAVYMFRTETPKREDLMLKRFTKRNSSPENWPGFLESTKHDLIVNNKNLSDMVQIDPVTGERYLSGQYASYVLCPNNPDFIKLYLEYLESIYKLGIDGIMTDDISMSYSNYDDRTDAPHNCACQYCRKSFKQQGGYDLPNCGLEWVEWRRNRESADFVAWMKFRKESVRNFHVKVKEHYANLGLRLLRPNYSATTVFWTNPGGYCFDLLPGLDWAFIENTFEHIIRYSWTEWVIEHNHRFALSRHRNIPAMAMYYPDREDTVRFCWALSLNCGIKYLGTTHDSNVNLNGWEKDLRLFEKDHRDSLGGSHKLAKIAFYFSRLTRDLYPNYEGCTRECQVAWMLACELKNIPYDMVLPEELERLSEYEVVILNEAMMMSKSELEQFRVFVKNGGMLIWIGNTASRTEDFSIRSFKKIWGHKKEVGEYQIGSGKLVVLELENWMTPLRRRVGSANRWEGNHFKCFDFKPVSEQEKELQQNIFSLLDRLLPCGLEVKIKNAPEGLLFHPFLSKAKDHITIHYINAIGTLDLPEEGYVTHDDRIPFPNYCETVKISVQKPRNWKQKEISSAKIFIPGEKMVELAIEDFPEYLVINLKPEQIKFYGLIKIT